MTWFVAQLPEELAASAIVASAAGRSKIGVFELTAPRGSSALAHAREVIELPGNRLGVRVESVHFDDFGGLAWLGEVAGDPGSSTCAPIARVEPVIEQIDHTDASSALHLRFFVAVQRRERNDVLFPTPTRPRQLELS